MNNWNRMVRFAGVLLLALAVIVRADEGQAEEKTKNVSPEAKKILEQSAEAVKKVNFAQYNGDYTSTAWIREFLPDITGKAIIGQPSSYDVPRFRCEIEMIPPVKPDSDEKPEARKLTAGSDGDNYFLIDPKEKTAYVDMDPAVLGANARDIQRLLMNVLVDKEPYEEELKADTIQKKDDAKVGSEACHVVHVKTDQGEAHWYISKSDLLPRRVERFYKNREDKVGSTDLVITDLQYSSKANEDRFAVTVPTGYKKTDEFAP